MPSDEQYAREQRGMDIIEASTPAHMLTNRDDIRGAAIDILTDILHALTRYGYDTENIHAIAWRHHMTEQNESAVA